MWEFFPIAPWESNSNLYPLSRSLNMVWHVGSKMTITIECSLLSNVSGVGGAQIACLGEVECLTQTERVSEA